MNNINSEIGIIVGRFQSPFLHSGNKEIIQHVINKHPKVYIFLRQSPLKCNSHDPLDFNVRRAMI